MFAVIRIRGEVNLKREIEDTLSMLRLHKVNHCVIIQKTPPMEGMLKKVKDFVTWGEISDDTLEKMIVSRGKLAGNKPIDANKAKNYASKIKKNEDSDMKPLFRLHPPKKGHNPIKQAHPKGALGPRGDKINDLILKMI